MNMEQKRNELIDYALDTRNKQLFMLFSGVNYAEHITRYYGMENLSLYLSQAEARAKKEETNQEAVNPTRLFVRWIEANKYSYHKLIIRFLLTTPSFIQLEDEASVKQWEEVNERMKVDWKLPNIVYLIEINQGLECAIAFNRFVRNYQTQQKESN